MVYAASLPKIAILLGALVEAERGRFALDTEHVAAMTNMIRFSSNEDATRVLKWVGEGRLLDILQSERFRLYDPAGGGGLWVGKGYGKDEAYQRDPVRNLSHGATAYQVARLYYLLANNALLTPRFNEFMKWMLSQSRHPPQVRQGTGKPPGHDHLPQVGHVAGLPRGQRAGRARRLPLRDRRPRPARRRRRVARQARCPAARPHRAAGACRGARALAPAARRRAARGLRRCTGGRAAAASLRIVSDRRDP